MLCSMISKTNFIITISIAEVTYSLHETVMIPNFSTSDCHTYAVSYYTAYM